VKGESKVVPVLAMMTFRWSWGTAAAVLNFGTGCRWGWATHFLFSDSHD